MALRAGAIRFNTDSSQMEIYDGNQWTGILATSPEQQTGGNTGIIGAVGADGSYVNTVDKVNMSSTGNAVNFGDVTGAQRTSGGISDSTRGIIPGVNGGTNKIEYITMSTTGNTVDFGDMYVAAASGGSVNSPTRGVTGGGDSPASVSYTHLTLPTSDLV